jgi:hypothetical protein
MFVIGVINYLCGGIYEAEPISSSPLDAYQKRDRVYKAYMDLFSAIERSGYVVATCMDCGEVVVCTPGRIAMCLPCVEKCIEVAAEAERAAS